MKRLHLTMWPLRLLCLLGFRLPLGSGWIAPSCSPAQAPTLPISPLSPPSTRHPPPTMAYRPRRKIPRSESLSAPAAPQTGGEEEARSNSFELTTPYQRVHEIGLARLYGRRRWYRELRRTGVSPAIRLGWRIPPKPEKKLQPTAPPPPPIAASPTTPTAPFQGSQALMLQLEEERVLSAANHARMKLLIEKRARLQNRRPAKTGEVEREGRHGPEPEFPLQKNRRARIEVVAD